MFPRPPMAEVQEVTAVSVDVHVPVERGLAVLAVLTAVEAAAVEAAAN